MTVLNAPGAEDLLGSGDMLFYSAGGAHFGCRDIDLTIRKEAVREGKIVEFGLTPASLNEQE